MAFLDPERDALVLRLIYDGPARSGKTTTLHALGEGLNRPVVSPGEADGRTLLFDWMEYTGGWFEGSPIHCQVVAVPGQVKLAERRRVLLSTADAVVVVLDSTRERLDESKAWLDRLRKELRTIEPIPAGLIIQANKRDDPDAVSTEVLQSTFEIGREAALFESVALRGRGTREAFVFGVRLGLDRARALRRAGLLPESAPEINSSEDLLASLESHEDPNGRDEMPGLVPPIRILLPTEVPAALDAVGSEDPGTTEESDPAEVDEGDPGRPPGPAATLPAGSIWPPVEGRLILHQARGGEIEPTEESSGAWIAEADGWRFRTGANQVFEDFQAGKQALLEEARRRVRLAERLSADRCLALVRGPGGRSWLWEVLRRDLSLGDLLRGAEQAGLPGEVANRLFRSARLLARATELAPSDRSLPPPSLETLGLERGKPVYLDFLEEGPFDPPLELPELLRRELLPHTQGLAARVGEIGWILRRLDELAGPEDRELVSLLRELASS